MTGWRFSLAQRAWEDGIDAVSTEERKREFWELAVRQFAVHEDPHPPSRASSSVASQRRGGVDSLQAGAGQRILDALHDDRQSGPSYRELGARPPLQARERLREVDAGFDGG